MSDAGGICLTATGLTGVMTDGNSDAAVQLHAGGGGIGIRSAANLEGCIQIEADGGVNETISIHSDQGTGVNAKGGSTDASINLISDAGGIGLYSTFNNDNAITIEANGGVNETIQIRSNLGTGVATADIANAVNASIALVSDAGGVALASGLNAAGSIFLEADAGTDETIVIHSNQGTRADSIELTSDVGGITLTSGGTMTLSSIGAIGMDTVGTAAINIGTQAAAKTITIGNDDSTNVHVNAVGIHLNAPGVTVNSLTGIGAGGGMDEASPTINVSKINGEIVTTILIDIGGGSIVSSSTAGDVIGESGVAAAYITKITTATNGIVYKGEIMCIEVPTTGDPDINLSAHSTELAEDAAGEGEHVLVNSGGWTVAKRLDFTIPSGGIIDDYLYFTHGGTTAGTYGAGKYVIKLYGANF